MGEVGTIRATQALKSSAVWCNGVARGVSWDCDVIVLQEGES